MLTYPGFLNSSPQLRQEILATHFGHGENFNATAFNAWFNQRVIGCEYWYRALPCDDQAKVIQVWKMELDKTVTESPCLDAAPAASSSSSGTAAASSSSHQPGIQYKRRY